MSRRSAPRTLPFPPGTELELEIVTLTNMGQGLGRVSLESAPSLPAEQGDATPSVIAPEGNPAAEPNAPPPGVSAGLRPEDRRGWVVLVPFALPGERIRARIWRNQRNYSEGDLLAVLRSSPHRVAAPCPLFTRCGGCQYQHLEYPAQLEWKRRQVAELLVHLARIEFPVNPVIGSPRAYGYRSKITPHFARPRPDRPLAIGFLRQGSRHAIVDVERCPLATDAINAALARERERIRASASRYKSGATLLLREAADGVTTDPAAVVRERVQGLELRFPAGEFFQNNPFLLDAFTAHVRERAAADGARHLVDAYCGSGLFCLTAAARFVSAVGIEISDRSIEWARRNATGNGVKNCSFIAGDAAAIFAQVEFAPAETAVVIDPPRKGADAEFLRQLADFGPRTIVYVSCNPATQMRDLTALLNSGYTLREVQPFDLFPQTRHLECVITLVRASDADARD